MYYSKRDKMIMMLLFAYNIYYVVILLSFLRHPNLGGITAPYLNKNVTSFEETTRFSNLLPYQVPGVKSVK